jgi:hypothetical protein
MSEFHKATKRTEVAAAVDLAPLGWGDARYVDISAGRGKSNELAQMRQCLLEYDAQDDRFAKIAFTGHRGSGKSTELLRFERGVSSHFTALHLYADEALLGDYDYTDLFLWLVDELVRKFEADGMPLNQKLADDVATWFAEVTLKEVDQVKSEIKAETEAKVGLSWFSLGLLARLKSIVSGSTERRKEIRRDLQSNSYELVKRVNLLLGNAHGVLGRHNKPANLLIVVDNLDRLTPEVSGRLFFENGEYLKQPKAHLIYTVPIATVLAPQNIGKIFDNKFTLPMVKVRNDKGRPNKPGIDSLIETIGHRVELDAVFAKPQDARKLAEMSGGNIRDLMRLVQSAQRIALVDDKDKIDSETVKLAVRRMRLEYEQILIPGRAYYPLLADINRTKSDGALSLEDAGPDKAQEYRDFFSQFLFNGSVLEYNGERMWYDVHPVIQEIEAFKKALANAQSPSQPQESAD